jgi:hypothetical protein
VPDSRIEDQIDRLKLAVEGFEASIVALGQEAFLTRLNGWSPRDILAHLIGWNHQVIEGGRQIQLGELPFYDVDPGENYSKVNAALVQKISANDLQALIQELHSSADDLMEYLRSLEPEAWAKDFGVRHGGLPVTLRGTVDELVEDYHHHRQQIREWANTR